MTPLFLFHLYVRVLMISPFSLSLSLSSWSKTPVVLPFHTQSRNNATPCPRSTFPFASGLYTVVSESLTPNQSNSYSASSASNSPRSATIFPTHPYRHITLSRCYARAWRRAEPRGSWTKEKGRRSRARKGSFAQEEEE